MNEVVLVCVEGPAAPGRTLLMTTDTNEKSLYCNANKAAENATECLHTPRGTLMLCGTPFGKHCSNVTRLRMAG